MRDRPNESVPAASNAAGSASPTSALVLATISFALSFAAWGLVGGLASVFSGLYHLTASQTALLVAVPVLLGSLARLPMGILTDRFGGRLVFTALLGFSSLAAFVVPLTSSYSSLLGAAFLVGMAGSSFSVGAAFVSRWTPAARQGTALGVYGLGTMGQSLAVFVGPVVAARLCMVSAGAANKKAFGIDRTTNPWADMVGTDVIWVAGSNVAECSPITTNYIWQAREQGAKIVVVLQLWLLTATMNAWLGGDDEVVWPAAAVSAAGLALNVGLLRYLGRIERRAGA